MSGKHNSIKAIFYALGANLGIAVAKTITAFITGSGSMFAEAIHSFADCANQPHPNTLLATARQFIFGLLL